jgi:CRP-like cAMP-binding protein
MAILDDSPRSATCLAKTSVECLEFNKENFRLLVTGNPQIALILLKLFCKRIYDQKRRFRILLIKDKPARIADVFCLFAEMNASSIGNTEVALRKFNTTISDVAHWAGISVEECRDELSKFSERRKIAIYDTYIVVNNINDMRRMVDSYYSMHEMDHRH